MCICESVVILQARIQIVSMTHDNDKDGIYRVHLLHPVRYNVNVGAQYYPSKRLQNQPRKKPPPCVVTLPS